MNKNERGIIYLIHFETSIHHARHYLGFTTDLRARLKKHRKGNGARLMSVVKKKDIEWRCVRTWIGPRRLERKLKNQHNGPRLCPVCNLQRKEVKI